MLSAQIYYLRKKTGMSQAQLAKKLHISASSLGMYEQGRRIPSVDILVNLSTIFDVSLDFLITGSEFVPVGSRAKDTDIQVNCPCSTCFWKEYKNK